MRAGGGRREAGGGRRIARLKLGHQGWPHFVAALVLGVSFASSLPLPASLDAQTTSSQPPLSSRGKAVYDKWCASCHGDDGAGVGVAATYMLPRPRDFTKAVYQIRTTASGEIPTDADLRRIVDLGMPGTAMPGWKSKLTETERTDVIAYIKSFSRFFAGKAPAAIEIGKAPSSPAEGIAAGRAAYQKLECFKCHGDAGRGDGTSAPTLTDDWDHPIRAVNLATSWRFNGGSTVEDIYARLRTGLDGTPMPSFSDAVESKVVSDEDLWRVAQYVRSLSPEEPPAVREVIRAGRVEGALPSGPADSSWARAERYFVPLTAQIIVKPRWFAPTVDGVWVQGLHDGNRLALRLTWPDPSKSPDPEWDEWLGRVKQAVFDADGAIPATQTGDRFVLQFPPRIDEEADRPYFLGGNTRRPVYTWRWTSTPDQVTEAIGTGLGKYVAATTSAVTHSARFNAGEWQLQLTRSLASADTTKAPVFREGQAIPVAFYAADGSNAEDDTRGSVSAWYAIYLDVPTPAQVYIAPIVTMLLTAGLGTMVVMQAQRREREHGRSNLEEYR